MKFSRTRINREYLAAVSVAERAALAKAADPSPENTRAFSDALDAVDLAADALREYRATRD